MQIKSIITCFKRLHCAQPRYIVHSSFHVLQGVEKVSKIKKKAFMLRVLVIVQPFLAVYMHGRWSVKKAAHSRYFTEHACILVA